MDDHVKIVEVEVLPYLPSGRLTAQALRRADVVTAFHTAFQMIGGVPRLALWADKNPGDFYKMYSRLLPSAASDELSHADKMVIQHALPPPRYNPASNEPDPAPAPLEVPRDDHQIPQWMDE